MEHTNDSRELLLFIENDGELYRQHQCPIMANLAKKFATGKYDHAKAVKLWGYMVEAGAKKYNVQFGDGTPSLKLFDKAARLIVAKELADYNLQENLKGA